MNVIQTWVQQLTMMQQSVLISAIRGPDGQPKYGPAKFILRWYRRCILLSAMDGQVLNNPIDTNGGSFTGPSCQPAGFPDWETAMQPVVHNYMRELDCLPQHFQSHLMHAAEIIGYRHPDERIRVWWNAFYVRLVHEQHLTPETEEAMCSRLGDSREGWLARADKATQD